MYMTRFLTLLACICSALCGLAQSQELTLDPAVRHGQLPCGLSYYIMYSPRPAYKANLYLITLAGSVCEEENERGLAHFLEHCAFNGSEHFPRKGIQTTLERHGLKFGYDINAATELDVTTYNLSNVDMPVNPSMLDTCLLALKDIACSLTLSDDAIEAERPIIIEEWREGADAFERYTMAAMPVLFGEGNRYAHRMPIGTPQVLQSFKPQELRDFYRRWYQPQHQAIVVIGYVRLDDVEAAIKRLWADVLPAASLTPRVWEQIPDHPDVRAGAFADPEFPGCQMDFWWLLPKPPRGQRSTLADYKDGLTSTLAMLALGSRIQDVLHEPDAPWTGGGADYDKYYVADSRNGFRLYAIYDRARRDEAMRRLITLAKTAAEAGLPHAELEAAREQVRSYADVHPQKMDERNNDEIFADLSRYIINDDVMLAPYVEQAIMRELLDSISDADINAFLRRTLRPANLAVMLAEKGDSAPASDSIASTVRRLWAEAEVDTVSAVDTTAALPLMAEEPQPGQLVEALTDEPFGAKICTFANGARVVICPSRVLSNQVDFAAVRPGGFAALVDSGYAEALFASDLAEASGMGAFSSNALRRRLAPTGIQLSTVTAYHSDVLMGSCRMDEIPTLLQLARLRMTEPRTDTVAFANWKRAAVGSIADSRGTPEVTFADSVSIAYYGHRHPLARDVSEEGVDTLSYPRAMRIFARSMRNPASFTYIITGDFNPDSIIPLAARYIGSLPAAKPAPKAKPDYRLRALPGIRSVDFTFPMGDDKATAHIGYELHRTFNVKSEMTLQALRLILETMLTQALRTEQGATYGTEVQADASEEDATLSLSVTFHTRASALDNTLATVRALLADIALRGPDAEMFQQVHSYLCENYYTATQQQLYPLEYYMRLALTGRRTVADRVPAIAAVTPSDVASLAASLLQADAEVTVTMRPAEQKSETGAGKS